MIIDDKKANRILEKYIANCYNKKCPFVMIMSGHMIYNNVM